MTDEPKAAEPTEITPVTEETPTKEMPAKETPAEESPAERGIPWAALGLAALLIAMVGGGVLSWPDWKHLVMPGKAQRSVEAPRMDELAALRTELAATRDRIQTLETRPAPGVDLAPLENRLTAQETALRALQAQPQMPRLAEDIEAMAKIVADLKRNSADAAAVLRLSDRVEKVETALRDVQTQRSSAAALMLAVGQLREALSKAMPFDAELRAVKALAPQDAELTPALEALKPRAVSGIPSFPTLAGRFHSLAPELVRAQVLPDQQSWWRQTLDRVATLVVIRREDGDAAGQSAAALVVRAEARLTEGDLAGAVVEAGRLEAGAAETVAPWLADARARLAADKAVSELTAHVVAQVGARQ